MTKITLLGDSIRIGYGNLVTEMLGDDYSVFQPDENCRFSKFTLRGLFDWRDSITNCDIVHWNNGLWDCTLCVDGEPFSDIDEYVKNMVRIGKILTQRCKKVIFATTTAVNDDGFTYDKNSIITKYNAAVVPELEKLGIQINDLFSVVYPNIDKYVCADKLHLTSEGYEALAKKVVESIKQAEASLKA